MNSENTNANMSVTQSPATTSAQPAPADSTASTGQIPGRDVTQISVSSKDPSLTSASATMMKTAEKADQVWYKSPKFLGGAAGVALIAGGTVFAGVTIVGGIAAAATGFGLPLAIALVAGAALGTAAIGGGVGLTLWSVAPEGEEEAKKSSNSPSGAGATPPATTTVAPSPQPNTTPTDDKEEEKDTLNTKTSQQQPHKIHKDSQTHTLQEMEEHETVTTDPKKPKTFDFGPAVNESGEIDKSDELTRSDITDFGDPVEDGKDNQVNDQNPPPP